MSINQQVNLNSGYNANPGSPNYNAGQTTSNYRATTTSNYGVNNGPIPNRGTTSYAPPQYVNNSQIGAQVGTQNYATTSYDNRNTHQVNTYGQPASTTRNTYNVEEPKSNPIANICFGLLGLIALVSLILGILFAVGVIGNKGTDVDPNVNAKGVTTNTHFRNIQHEFVELPQDSESSQGLFGSGEINWNDIFNFIISSNENKNGDESSSIEVSNETH